MFKGFFEIRRHHIPAILLFVLTLSYVSYGYGSRYISQQRLARNEALIGSVRSGDLDETMRLIESGADTNYVKTMTPLYYALENQRWAIAKYLISHGARFDVRIETNARGNLLNCTLLRRTEEAEDRQGQIDLARLLIERGVDINHREDSGATPLFRACLNGLFDIASELIRRGADVNARTINNATALYWCVVAERADGVQYLLDHGADPSIKFENRIDAVSLAREKGYLRIVKMIEDFKRDHKSVDPSGH
jgi:ankyrin repeat protein